MVAVALALRSVRESKGDDGSLDLPGMVLVSGMVTLTVWAIVQAGTRGWSSVAVLAPLSGSAVLLATFVWWQRRNPSPLLPLRFYRQRTFVLASIVSLAMFFGVFGSIFFLTQYFQGALGYGPLEAGVRTLPWTAMPMLVAPIAGALIDRVGGSRLMAIGLALQGVGLAWIAAVASVGLAYGHLAPALGVSGIGMGLVFAPTMAVVLGAVHPHEYGKASGANNTIREIGGALGIAVLTTVFQNRFTVVDGFPFDSAGAFVTSMTTAIWVGVAVLEVAAVLALFIPVVLRNGSDDLPPSVANDPRFGERYDRHPPLSTR